MIHALERQAARALSPAQIAAVHEWLADTTMIRKPLGKDPRATRSGRISIMGEWDVSCVWMDDQITEQMALRGCAREEAIQAMNSRLADQLRSILYGAF